MLRGATLDSPEHRAQDAHDLVMGHAQFHPGQLAFLLSESPITVGLAGIRGGKTHVGAFKSILYAIENPCGEDEYHLVCSPTYPMSKVPIEKLYRLLYDKTLFPICPLIKYVKSERTFILASVNGGVTKIKVVSLHDPDKIRGIKARSAWIDEGAYITMEAWTVVQGRVADSAGPIWITTTPAGYNFIHELYEAAVAERDAGVPIEQRVHRFVHWKSTDNTFIPQEGLQRLAASYDSRTYAQEVLGLFVKAAGLVYHGFGRKNIRPGRLDRRLPLFVGQDFNVSLMASVFTQPCRVGVGIKGLHAIHEREAPDSNTPELARYLDRYCAENNYPKHQVRIHPDASGGARKTSGRSDHQILKEAGFKVVYVKKNPFVKDRVNCLNGLLSPQSGPPRYYVDPNLKRLVQCFSKQIWTTDKLSPEPDKTQGFDHLLDAAGYTAWSELPLRMSATLGSHADVNKYAMRKAA